MQPTKIREGPSQTEFIITTIMDTKASMLILNMRMTMDITTVIVTAMEGTEIK
jgi:hypothetical protein